EFRPQTKKISSTDDFHFVRRRNSVHPQRDGNATAVVRCDHCAETFVPLRWYGCTNAPEKHWYKNAVKSTLQFIHIQRVAKEYGSTALPCGTFQTADDTIKADFLRLYLEYVCACAHLN
ncbi:MAG: hypothetical protein II801_05340, partial [Bacteroidaceae bacterium]|nr:hypothetical protein [Bacteroidaceae bacterium]